MRRSLDDFPDVGSLIWDKWNRFCASFMLGKPQAGVMLLPGRCHRDYLASLDTSGYLSPLVILSFHRHMIHKCERKKYQGLHGKASLSPAANTTSTATTNSCLLNT